MDMQKKKRLFLIGGAVLAALIVAVALAIALGGRSGAKRYERHYNAAEAAFLRQDYDTALDELDRAMGIESTEECYLLMADVYYAKGDTERAVQVLYLGYSRAGGERIAAMLERLKGAEDEDDRTAREAVGVTVGGRTFAPDTTAVVLSGKRLGNADLEALCTLTGLESLSISDNEISDLTPVAGLGRLTSLQLSGNNVRDISALSGLTNLKTLYLDGNPVQDLTPLYGLGELRTLSMKNTGASVKDISALEAALPECSVFTDAGEEEVREITLGGKTFFSDVTELNLGGLGITDISALGQCRNLRKLDLRDNRIEDISPLVELRDLEWLCLWNNEVADITPLMSLTELEYLDVDTNRIRDIAALEYLTDLEELWLNNNALRSFDALKRLSGLRRLGLKNTGAGDGQLPALYGLTELRELTIEENAGITADAYAKLEAALPRCAISHSELLYTVTLGGETFTSDATEIRVPDSEVTDLSGLEHFTDLTLLDLDGNAVADFTPLFGLAKLRTLSVRGNGLTDETLEELRERLPECMILTDAKEKAAEPEAGAESYAATGSSAALAAAGTGSGYAILWDGEDPVSAGVREGLAATARELGMNVIYEDSVGEGADYAGHLAMFQAAGVDVVFLILGDGAISGVLARAQELGYTPQFVQVYG